MEDGLDALDDALHQLQQALSGAALQHCTDAAAAPILSEARARAPVRHGDVRNNLGTVSQHTETSATTTVQVAQSGPGGVAHEAIFLEYGTSSMPAQPFMRQAFESAKAGAIAGFNDALRANLPS